MYVFSNALRNLVRNKGRNILIAVIVLHIVVGTAVCMVINTTTGDIIEDYKGRFGAEVSIEMDYEKILQTGQREVIEPTHRQLVAFGQSDYLQKAEYEGIRWGTVTGLKSPFSTSDEEPLKAYVVGNSQSNIGGTFGESNRKMVSGNMYQTSGDCVIEKEFADYNNLKVGDTIAVDVPQDEGAASNPRTLTITGIFQDYTYMQDGNWDRDNDPMTILVHTDTMVDMDMVDLDSDGWLFAKYYLKEPGMLDAFSQELHSKGLSDDMKVTADEDGYQKVVGPVEGLSSISMTFLVVILVLGYAILLLISILGIRERKYEIGVLRAMGMEKRKVALGFFSESFVITALCLAVGLGIGLLLAQPVANTLLAGQVAATQQGTAIVNSVMDMNSSLTPLTELTVTFSLTSIFGICAIALIIVLVSSLASILYVMRYEPMRILSERN